MTVHLAVDFAPRVDPEPVVPCCDGSAFVGPGRCTCWVPVFDREQSPELLVGAPTVTRAKCCDDCAFRVGSPERAGSAEVLDDLVGRGRVFWCHEGMRRPVQLVHPDGRVAPGDPADYQPPEVSGRPYRADGMPAEVCAGWSAWRDAAERSA